MSVMLTFFYLARKMLKDGRVQQQKQTNIININF